MAERGEKYLHPDDIYESSQKKIYFSFKKICLLQNNSFMFSLSF